MIIKIDALDTLFFRDGRPFAMGEDTWANSIFPCYPSVIYGVLRATYFANNVSKISLANTESDPTASLKIQAIYLKINDTFYWPLPLDCVKIKGEKAEDGLIEVFLIKRNSKIREDIVSNYPCTDLLHLPEGPENQKVDNVPDGILDEYTLREYLYSKWGSDSVTVRQLSDCITLEPKIGIGRDKTTQTTSDEQKLYRVEMIRPANISEQASIVVEFTGIDIPSNGFMKLGGENKAVYYEEIDGIRIEPPKLKNKVFKLYLATPAMFEKGWLPGWVDEESLTGTYKGIKLKLLTAAIGKYISIGGFDMRKKEPKTMYKAVPAGSVYYFELVDGNLTKVVDVFHGKSVSDFQSEQGFGLALVGEI
ncbi:type III-B CRISPR module-associated protein Cmr3 [Peptococcaceae bacterium]|nr:type III-B CRISPR module-associated protein Cmr3 [Peptococcaceae bacterium]